jgi:hypothetical protein
VHGAQTEQRTAHGAAQCTNKWNSTPKNLTQVGYSTELSPI